MTTLNTDKYYTSLSRAPSSESVANRNRPMRNHPKAPLIIDIKVNTPESQQHSEHDDDSTERKRSFSGVVPNRRKRKRRSISSDIDNDNEETNNTDDTNNNNTNNSNSNSNADDNDDLQIWSDDVEIAFREALEIIPKHGLNKIKISGRTCGRNELVADYILSKTGKSRTRKQISSHIQVLKNLNRDKRLMKLIVDGPDDRPEIKEKFSEIFGNISFQKSIGNNESSNDNDYHVNNGNESNGRSITNNNKNNSNNNKYDSESPQIKMEYTDDFDNMDDVPHQVSKTQLKNIKLEFEDFEMKLSSQSGSHEMTHLPISFMDQPLKIRDNANIARRFPKLYQVVQDIEKDITANTYDEFDEFDEDHSSDQINSIASSNNVRPQIVPILHGMINLLAPSLEQSQISSADLQCRCNSKMTLRDVPIQDEKFMSLTLLYSSGKLSLTTFEKLDYDVLSSNQNTKDISMKVKLAPNYWVGFFKDLYKLIDMKYSQDPDYAFNLNSGSKVGGLISKGIRRITMKQIIFTVSSKTFESPFNVSTSPSLAQPKVQNTKMNFDIIKPRNIRSIILWEFNKVDMEKEANMSLRSIYLPLDVNRVSSVVSNVGPLTTSDSNLSSSETTPQTSNSSYSYNHPIFKDTFPDFNDTYGATNFHSNSTNGNSDLANHADQYQYQDNQPQLQKLDLRDLSLSPPSPQLNVDVDVTLPIQLNHLPMQPIMASTTASNIAVSPGFTDLPSDLHDLNIPLGIPLPTHSNSVDPPMQVSATFPNTASTQPMISSMPSSSAITSTSSSFSAADIDGNISMKQSLIFPSSSSNRSNPISLNIPASLSNFTMSNGTDNSNPSTNTIQDKNRGSSITTSNANGTTITTTNSGMGSMTSTTVPMVNSITGGLLNSNELIATPYLAQFPGLGNGSASGNGVGIGISNGDVSGSFEFNKGGFSFY